ncbi:hypothetical protein CASFOL_024206 [Castilleja foliolosa]|uniref:Uncharacterized protein n=1 Tax=Castilleja foliolosa TaxID=1961234 RepID=A0ABD3CP22_9LAMI
MGKKRSTSSKDKRRKKRMLKVGAFNDRSKHPKLLSCELESSKAGAAIDNKTMGFLSSRELLSMTPRVVTDKKVVRRLRLLSGLPESLDDVESCEDITDERSDDYETRMLMRVAVETLKENKLLRRITRGKLCLKVPEDKIEYLLKMVQTKSDEVQMKSDIIIGFEELKQVEAAAKYIYVRKMFKVENRGGEKFMQIPHDKMSRVAPYSSYRFRFYG